MVIYPVTLLRLAMGAIEDGLRTILHEGSQVSLIPKMQTRTRLYELVHYDEYAAFDDSIANFRL